MDDVFFERLWRSLNRENIATAVDTTLRLDGASALCPHAMETTRNAKRRSG